MNRVGDTMYKSITGNEQLSPACYVDFGIEEDNTRLTFLDACYKAEEAGELSGDILQDMIFRGGAVITEFVHKWTGSTEITITTVYDELGW